ncbi:hypothetical protein TNCV_1407441 [Trichonephila clavipes]|nr:hypothetical protein TNCV_1407441 [Trichonephila clavipes]
MAPESGHFITGGLYTCFANWRFVHKARLNLTPSRAVSLGSSEGRRSVGRYESVKIVPIIVVALEAWDPANDRFLSHVATKGYLRMLRKLCVSDTIRWSRDIYIQHLTDKQQYENDCCIGHWYRLLPSPSPSQVVSNPEGCNPV